MTRHRKPHHLPTDRQTCSFTPGEIRLLAKLVQNASIIARTAMARSLAAKIYRAVVRAERAEQVRAEHVERYAEQIRGIRSARSREQSLELIRAIAQRRRQRSADIDRLVLQKVASGARRYQAMADDRMTVAQVRSSLQRLREAGLIEHQRPGSNHLKGGWRVREQQTVAEVDTCQVG